MFIYKILNLCSFWFLFSSFYRRSNACDACDIHALKRLCHSRNLPTMHTWTSNYSAHGYNAFIHASYAPVSRRDSELASLSSGRTDSDTMSISSRSTWVLVVLVFFCTSKSNSRSVHGTFVNSLIHCSDGRPHRHHQPHQNPHERRVMRDSLAANRGNCEGNNLLVRKGASAIAFRC